jgi:hypothetical protein
MYFLHKLLPAALAPFIVATSVLAASTPSQRATLGLPVQLSSGGEVVPFHPETTFKVFHYLQTQYNTIADAHDV